MAIPAAPQSLKSTSSPVEHESNGVTAAAERESSEPYRKGSSRLVQIVQRYMVPSILASAYYFLKYRCLISGKTQVQLSSRISFGKGTNVRPYSVIRTKTGRIRIGRECDIGSFNFISAGKKDVVIGDYVGFGMCVTIVGNSRGLKDRNELMLRQPPIDEGIVVEDDVMIGSNSVLLPGVHVGRGSVIAAGSVVTKNVPPYTIVGGTPAKPIGKRE